MRKPDKIKASWINKDGFKTTIQSPDDDIEKLKKQVNYYNKNNNKVTYYSIETHYTNEQRDKE